MPMKTIWTGENSVICSYNLRLEFRTPSTLQVEFSVRETWFIVNMLLYLAYMHKTYPISHHANHSLGELDLTCCLLPALISRGLLSFKRWTFKTFYIFLTCKFGSGGFII